MSYERERLSIALAAMTDQRDYQMDRARKAHLRANNLRGNNQRLLAELEQARAALPNVTLDQVHEWAEEIADHFGDQWPHTPTCQGEAGCPLCYILDATSVHPIPTEEASR